MTDGTPLSAGEFGVAFKGFLEQTVSQTPSPTSFFVTRLTDHFGMAPTGLPIVGEQFACVQFGLYLVKDVDAPLAILVRGADTRGYAQASVNVEVMSAERADAERFLTEIRTRMRRRNVYRGRVVSLAVKPPMGALEVKFHRLPPVDRDGIVLPTDVLDRIERHTIRIAAHRERLLAAGRHLKRGLLLWGPPGTGKTLTAMYLARQMPDRTVLLLTGKSLGLIETSCTMARLLQ